MRFGLQRKPTADALETKAVQVRQEVQASKLQAVIDAIPVGITLSNSVGEQTAINTRAIELQADYQRAALLQAATSRAATQARKGSAYREALDFSGVDARSFLISATPLSDGGSVAVIEDVSERRQIEAIRRDFVTNVGHELRTPIGAIVVLAESLEGETNAGAVAEMRRHIVSEANRAAHLIDELLSLSKVQNAKDVTFETFSVGSLVDGILSEVNPSALGAKVDLLVLRSENDAQMRGVFVDLVSAVGNLVLNAIKYSGDSKVVHLKVALEGEMVSMTVTDNGIGIPAQDQERIFERFYRVDRSRDRSTGGSGIGLAIVRHVAANHGGWVSVESREGEGSTFTFAVPLNLVEA